MAIAEDVEDVEHRFTRLIHGLALQLDYSKQVVECRLVFGAAGKRYRQFYAQRLILGVGGDLLREIVDVRSARRGEACSRLKANDFIGGSELAEDDEGFVVAAGGNQQSRQTGARLLMVGLFLEGGTEELESLTDGAITVFVDITGVEARGSYVLPVLVHLPPGIDVSASVDPETVDVIFENP